MYKIQDKATDKGFVFIRIKKGMYGLKQAAILAYDQLKAVLKPHGYFPVEGTVGLWQHVSKPTRFCLCVDDFGVKYFKKEDAEHLLNAIGSKYNYTVDWGGTNYCGLNIDWHYEKGYVDIYMLQYVSKALKRLQHRPTTTPQYSPHAHTPIVYGMNNTQQFTADKDTSPLLTPKETKYIQSVTGTFLYYGRGIDYTILPAIYEIAAQQAHPTKHTMAKAN